MLGRLISLSSTVSHCFCAFVKEAIAITTTSQIQPKVVKTDPLDPKTIIRGKKGKQCDGGGRGKENTDLELSLTLILIFLLLCELLLFN